MIKEKAKVRSRMSLKKRWALTVLVSVLAFFFSYEMVMYQQLPPRVATHFDTQGMPNGWMTKDQYALFNIVILTFIAGLIVVIAFLIPRMPDGLINIPRRKYWLAPERRKSSLETISVFLLWIAVCTAAFHFTVVHLVDRVNLGNPRPLGNEFWIVLAVYLAILFLICSWMIIRFMSVDRTAVDESQQT